MTRALARVYVICLRAAQGFKRSKRAVGLAGLAGAVLVAASLGLSLPLAGFGPEAPPLVDTEAHLGDLPPLAHGEQPGPAPRDAGANDTDLVLQPAAVTAAAPALPDPAGRIALAIEAAPAAVNRLVEVRRGDTLMNLLVKQGVERREAHGAISALSEVFSPRRLKAGQVIRLAMLPGDTGHNGTQVASDSGPDEALRLISLGLTQTPKKTSWSPARLTTASRRESRSGRSRAG